MGGKGAAFSLLEVVLSLGVFSLAVLGLLGLFAPMLAHVGEQLDTAEAETLPPRLKYLLHDAVRTNPALLERIQALPSGQTETLYAWRAGESSARRQSLAAMGTSERLDAAVAVGPVTGAVFALQVYQVEPQANDPAWFTGSPLGGDRVPSPVGRLRVVVFARPPPAPDAVMADYRATLVQGGPLFTFFSTAPRG